jgi:hypothetical protein
MSSFLDLKTGIYDPTKRFAFTNIGKDDFTFTWGKVPIKVAAGETVELPHYLAVLATQNLVDKIMIEEIREKEAKVREETRNPLYRARTSSLGVPAARKPYEDKILKELAAKTGNDAQLNVIRAKLAEEITRDLKAEPAEKISAISQVMPVTAEQIADNTLGEFADINIPKTH